MIENKANFFFIYTANGFPYIQGGLHLRKSRPVWSNTLLNCVALYEQYIKYSY